MKLSEFMATQKCCLCCLCSNIAVYADKVYAEINHNNAENNISLNNYNNAEHKNNMKCSINC